MLKNPLANFAEQLIRHRRALTILAVFVGNPVLGAVYGLAANVVAILIVLAPLPYSYIALAAIVVMLTALGEFIGGRSRETTGDAANRGLTRTHNAPWIPSQDRPLNIWNYEPWRTAVVVTLIVMAGINGASEPISWGFLPENPWILSAIIGAIAALVRSLLTKQIWSGLLRRGPIPT